MSTGLVVHIAMFSHSKIWFIIDLKHRETQTFENRSRCHCKVQHYATILQGECHNDVLRQTKFDLVCSPAIHTDHLLCYASM